MALCPSFQDPNSLWTWDTQQRIVINGSMCVTANTSQYSLTVAPCQNNFLAQQWAFNTTDFRVRSNLGSNLCMDQGGAGRVGSSQCNTALPAAGFDNQMWNFTGPPPAKGQPTLGVPQLFQSNGQCLCLRCNELYDLQMQACPVGPDARFLWTVDSLNRIVSGDGTVCLSSSSAMLAVVPCQTNAPDQQWPFQTSTRHFVNTKGCLQGGLKTLMNTVPTTDSWCTTGNNEWTFVPAQTTGKVGVAMGKRSVPNIVAPAIALAVLVLRAP